MTCGASCLESTCEYTRRESGHLVDLVLQKQVSASQVIARKNSMMCESAMGPGANSSCLVHWTTHVHIAVVAFLIDGLCVQVPTATYRATSD